MPNKFLAACLIIIIGALIALISTPILNTNAQSNQQWEYLRVTYLDLKPFMEFVRTSDTEYNNMLFEEMLGDCDYFFTFIGAYPPQKGSCLDDYEGREYWLNIFGSDGWELVTISEVQDWRWELNDIISEAHERFNTDDPMNTDRWFLDKEELEGKPDDFLKASELVFKRLKQ